MKRYHVLKHILALTVVGCIMSFSVYAEEDTLHDNVLEYSELEELIRESNVTVQNSWASTEKSLEDYTNALETLKFWGSSASVDQKNAKKDGDTEEYINASTERQIYKSGVKTFKSMLDSLNKVSSSKSQRQVEKQTLVAAQSLMITYESLQNSQKTWKQSRELYEKQYQDAVVKEQSGLGTSADTLLAKNQLLSAEASLESLESTIESTYDSICLMIGRETDGTLQIQSIPEADVSKISTYNLETDTEKAIGNNYTLISDRSGGTTSTAATNRKQRLTAEDDEKMTMKMNSLYQEILSKKADLEAEQTSYRREQQSKNIADIKYNQGMLGTAEYLSEELSYIQAEADLQAADLALFQAMENYQWAVEGIADIG